MEVLIEPVMYKTFHTFLESISIIAYLQMQLAQVWEKTEYIVALPQNTSYVKVVFDQSVLVGMPFIEERIIPVKYHIYIDIENERNKYKGGWLLLYVFDPETKQLFYWTTEMITVYQKGLDNDITQASQLSTISLLNAPSGGGIRITSSYN